MVLFNGYRYGQFIKGKEPLLACVKYEISKHFLLFIDSFNEMRQDFTLNHPQLVSSDKKLLYSWTFYYLRKKALSSVYNIPPNNLLKYGYVILRVAVACSLVGTGLLPTLGIFYTNKYNAYCFADKYIKDIVYKLIIT